MVGSNKKSNVGACKSYCMNFDSFKIVDSSLPYLRIVRSNSPQVFTDLVSWEIISFIIYFPLLCMI